MPDEFEMSNVPGNEADYSPTKNDTDDYQTLIDDGLDSRFKTFSKENSISLSLHQKLIKFQLSCLRDDIGDETIMMKRFDDFATAEKLNPALCNKIITFQKTEAKKYKDSIEQIQKNSASVTKRLKTETNAHRIHKIKNSKAYMNVNDPGHKATIKEMIELCGSKNATLHY